uniref:TRP C-terminal domain-containing protein n=1 Tax=Globisporangium ultimum (strain ATCC 200006 / CBS 805.95 / DAOM BR144) TaxID=431595 RepID=K3X020_GLOUD
MAELANPNGFNLIHPDELASTKTSSVTSSGASENEDFDAKTVEVKTHEKDSSVKAKANDEQAEDKATSFKAVEETKTTITLTDGSKKQTFEKYDRDSNAKIVKRAKEIADEVEDGSTKGNISGSAYGSIIGGGNRANPPPGADIELSPLAQKVQNVMRYCSYAFALVSMVLLGGFHVLALKSPSWLTESIIARRTDGSWFTPTTWEFVAVLSYFQHLGSISMLELTKAPYIILDFTDSFSWVNFHMYAIVSTAARRLQFIILTGIVSYTDRLGIDEGMVLVYTTRFFLVLVGILLAIFIVFAAASQCAARLVSEKVRSQQRQAAWKSGFAPCIIGLGVALWLLSIFPLITVSTYELMMQIRYQVSGKILVAMADMWVVVVATLCFLFYKVRSIRLNDSFTIYNHAAYGTLYADTKQAFRYYFVAFVFFQVIVGVLTGGVQDVPDQLVALLIMHLIFCVVLTYLAPFADVRVQIFMVLLNVFRIINLSLSFAFLTVSELETSSRALVAHSFVIFNFLIIFVLFVRHVGIFIMTLRRWVQNLKLDNDESSMLSQDFSNETPMGKENFGANSRLPTVAVVVERHPKDRGTWV